MYKLLMLVDDEWYQWGTYASVTLLAEAAHYLGTTGVPQIKVEVLE